MSKKDNISISVIRRLPRYYRFLSELLNAGVVRISSTELAVKMGVTASQIRQDLNCFGGFGQQGYGYHVEHLRDEISNILGLSNAYNCILIGAGNLGCAIAKHIAFDEKGFNLVGILDRNSDMIGKNVNGITVQNIQNLEQVCKEHNPVMAVLCIPKDSANRLSKRLYNLGIKNYWNFSHYNLVVDYPDVIVENVHLNDSLMTLCYRVSERTREKSGIC